MTEVEHPTSPSFAGDSGESPSGATPGDRRGHTSRRSWARASRGDFAANFAAAATATSSARTAAQLPTYRAPHRPSPPQDTHRDRQGSACARRPSARGDSPMEATRHVCQVADRRWAEATSPDAIIAVQSGEGSLQRRLRLFRLPLPLPFLALPLLLRLARCRAARVRRGAACCSGPSVSPFQRLGSGMPGILRLVRVSRSEPVHESSSSHNAHPGAGLCCPPGRRGL